MCKTLLSKANINGWDNQVGCHNGQEGEDCYQEGEDDQKDGPITRMVTVPRMVTILSEDSLNYFEFCRLAQ